MDVDSEIRLSPEEGTGFEMKLMDAICLRFTFPLGILFCAGYAVEPVRMAVEDYIPEVMFIPFGLLCFFAFGSCIGIFVALLFVPEAILNKRGNRLQLKETLGVEGAWAVRTTATVSLGFFLLALYVVLEKAYG